VSKKTAGEEFLNALMTVDRLSAKEVQFIRNRPVVRVAFLDIAVPSSKMSRQEAEACIIELKTNGNRALVARHATEASLRNR
jgi:hypothetical protein